MNHLIWPVSLVGILCTAVVFGTDMFFLTVGRPAAKAGNKRRASWVAPTASVQPSANHA
jgi:hypothetical protein